MSGGEYSRAITRDDIGPENYRTIDLILRLATWISYQRFFGFARRPRAGVSLPGDEELGVST